MKHIFLIIGLFILTNTIKAQHIYHSNNRDDRDEESLSGRGYQGENAGLQKKKEVKAEEKTFSFDKVRPKIKNNANTRLSTNKLDNHFELYRSIVKQKGWFRGIGKPLSKDYASHLPCYFKLSHKDSNGHWQRIEALDGYGKPTINHNIAIYLSDYSDTLVTDNVKESFSKACIWEFIADATGKNVAQERAYDSGGNLIYTYTPVVVKAGTPIEGTTVIGSYSNQWGVGLSIRKDGGDYARITWDKNGYEASVECLDKNGLQLKNRAGAFVSKYEYTDNGLLTRYFSCNEDGNKIIDLYGNCGMQMAYDTNGILKAETSCDNNWNVCPVTNLGDGIQYIQHSFKYDDYGRIIEMTFQNGYGKDTINNVGVCRQLLKYNAHGQLLEEENLNLSGKLTAKSNDGEDAKYVFNYDNNGNCILKETYDATNKYIQSNQWLAKIVRKYDKGDIVLEEKYLCDEDTLVRTGRWIEKGNGYVKYRDYNKNHIEIDSLDNKGQVYVVETTDFAGNYIKNYNFNRYIIKRSYPSKGIYVEEYSHHKWDGTLVEANGFATEICRYDSTECTKLTKDIDEKGKVINCSEEKYEDNTFSNCIGVYSVNRNGNRVRTGNADGEYYYYKRFIKNSAGETIRIQAENEFGELSYVTTDKNELYSIKLPNNSKNKFYNTEGKEIKFQNGEMNIHNGSYWSTEWVKYLPKANSIDILDTLGSAYNAGLRDGDIIQDLDYNLFIMHSNESKQINILRLNTKGLSYYPVTINLPNGTMSDMGFTICSYYITSSEKERINKAISFINENQNDKYSVIVGMPSNINTAKDYTFHLRNQKDPFIVLGVKTEKNHLFCKQNIGKYSLNDTIPFEILSSKEISYQLICTKNGIDIDSIYFYISPEDVKFSQIYIGKSEYGKLLEMSRNIMKDTKRDKSLTFTEISDSLMHLDMKTCEVITNPKTIAKLTGQNWAKGFILYKYNNSNETKWKIEKLFSSIDSKSIVISHTESLPSYDIIIDSLNNKEYRITQVFGDSIRIFWGNAPRSYIGESYVKAMGPIWSNNFKNYANKAITYDYKVGYGLLGDYYIDKNDTTMAIHYWQLADTINNGEYLNDIGQLYTSKHDDISFPYLIKAAECGNSDAANRLGMMYQAGSGVAKDEKRAFYWYSKAHAKGNSSSYIASDMANCYERGIGVEVDTIKALQYRIEELKKDYSGYTFSLFNYVNNEKWRTYLYNQELMSMTEILRCWLRGTSGKRISYYDDNWQNLTDRKAYRYVFKQGTPRRLYYVSKPIFLWPTAQEKYQKMLSFLNLAKENLVSGKGGVKIYKIKNKIKFEEVTSYIVIEDNRISLFDGDFK